MNKRLLLLGGILILSFNNASAQVWGIIPNHTTVPTETTGPVSIGTNHTTLPWFNGSSLSVLNGENVGSSTVSPSTLRLVKLFVGPGYLSGYQPGNIIEALTDNQIDPPGPPPPPAPNPVTGFVLTSGFNMGIGTAAPVARLNVHNGEIALTNASPIADRTIKAHTNSGTFRLMTGNSIDNPYIEMGGKLGAFPGQMNFVNSDVPGGKFEFLKCDGTTWVSQMTISNNGKVTIGNVPINSIGYDYKLYVENGILTPRIKVALPSTNDWSDFVFDKDYKLMPLSEVEEYIKVNMHLPQIPSAADVVKDGVDLGAMDAKLLQKVEELTLYVIQQQKQIDDLRTQISKRP